MALVTMKALMSQAQEARRGIGAFNVGNMEMVRGVILAAEETETPVILQLGCPSFCNSPKSVCVILRCP